MRNFAIKRGLLVLAFVASILFPAGVNAFYSPADRPTFTWENAASYVTFNSITNNPVAGDERPFLDGKVTTASGNNVDKINVKSNDEVVLRVYFHNNAKASLNLVSTNTKVKILLPKTPKTATYAAGYITSDNANPRVVADTAVSVACMKSIPVALQCVLLMITIRNYESSGFGVSFCCFLWPVRPCKDFEHVLRAFNACARAALLHRAQA